ncbi:radical SAM protein [bacterium]|nr:radical SAM protein [bacterium]
MFVPAYLRLSIAEIERRAKEAIASLEHCRVCPRNCDVDRLNNKHATCRTGRFARVGSYGPHFGEEDCLRGWNGSGTIFFGLCNLRCVFCQNWDISQMVAGVEATPKILASMMMALQDQGCHNINFVTPEHVVPQILEALPIAIQRGLTLPIVYNTSAYDSMESMKWMESIVDIYMPDFKFYTEENGKVYAKAIDYGEVARRTIKEMHRQVGDLVMDDRGLAKRGVLVRHLVMPNGKADTSAVMHWIMQELGPQTYVNVMSQYYPAHKTEKHPEIHRRIDQTEFLEAVQLARAAGLKRLDERSIKH